MYRYQAPGLQISAAGCASGSQQQLLQRRLLDAIPDLIRLEDHQGVLIDCNQAFLDFMGLMAGEALGRRVPPRLPVEQSLGQGEYCVVDAQGKAQVQPVTVRAIVDRNNDVADASVRWSIDDSDLITLLPNDDEESGYTKKSASVQVNLNSSFITDIVRKLEKEQADRLILLGDLLYHGPRNDLPKEYAPKEVIQMLNKEKNRIYNVRGNCDAEVDQMVLEFPILADYCFLEIDGRTIFASHGHHHNPKNPPMLKKGDILLNGHTHIPANEDMGDFIYMNPGSVSIPKEGSAHGYMICEGGEFTWKDLEGNIVGI